MATSEQNMWNLELAPLDKMKMSLQNAIIDHLCLDTNATVKVLKRNKRLKDGDFVVLTPKTINQHTDEEPLRPVPVRNLVRPGVAISLFTV